MDQNLQRAKNAIDVMQAAWWLSNYDNWDIIAAWQRCVIPDIMIDYSLLSEDFSYTGVIEAAINNNSGLSGNDDDLWSAIAALKAFYLTGDQSYWNKFVTYEYNEIKNKYWDNVCNGGVWWDYAKTYKNAITNELWLYFVTLMYLATGNDTYLQDALKAWKWFAASGMINSQNLINDGLRNCQNNGGTTWTYNQGMILGGLANLQLITNDGTITPYATTAASIANAVMALGSMSTDGILTEPTGSMDLDQQSFKGIFMAKFGYLAAAFPSLFSGNAAAAYITANANQVANNRTTNGRIDAYWTQTGNAATVTPAAQSSGIALFNAAFETANARPALWSYVRTVCGVGTSTDPDSCTFNNRLYLVWRGVGNDGGIYFTSMNSGENWTGQIKINGVGAANSPSIAVFNGRLYAAWRGYSESAIFFASMDTGENWKCQQTIGGATTDSSPCLVAFNGRLYAAWRGTGSDGAIYVAAMDAAESWTTPSAIPSAGTSNGVTMTVLNNQVFAVWKGYRESSLFASVLDASGNWSFRGPIGSITTDCIPAVQSFNNQLYLAWRGSDKHLWFASGSNTNSLGAQTKFVIPGVTTRNPRLSTFNASLYNVYAGGQTDENSILYSCNPYSGIRGF